jgi:hypothetical protein
MPSEVRKKFIVSKEKEMKGKTPLGNDRTVSGVVKAIEPRSQMGISIQSTKTVATR